MRVVIERGHGPYDSGAVGPTGLTEFEVTQALCKRLRDMGYEVKGRDKLLSVLLWALRLNKPDVVVSIHCNAGSKTRHECQVYHWRYEPNVEVYMQSQALANAIADRARGFFAEKASVQWFPVLVQGKHGLERRTPGIVKGTAKLAAVVVETGFISCPHTEEAMRTESWRDRAALAIHEGIQDWRKAKGG